MESYIRNSFFLAATVSLMMGSAALAQTIAPSTQNSAVPSPSFDMPSVRSNVTTEDAAPDALQVAPVAQEEPSSCPPGQFLSAFPDVTPNDWAYEAVNRLASNPPRCFPITPQS